MEEAASSPPQRPNTLPSKGVLGLKRQQSHRLPKRNKRLSESMKPAIRPRLRYNRCLLRIFQTPQQSYQMLNSKKNRKCLLKEVNPKSSYLQIVHKQQLSLQ